MNHEHEKIEVETEEEFPRYLSRNTSGAIFYVFPIIVFPILTNLYKIIRYKKAITLANVFDINAESLFSFGAMFLFWLFMIAYSRIDKKD